MMPDQPPQQQHKKSHIHNYRHNDQHETRVSQEPQQPKKKTNRLFFPRLIAICVAVAAVLVSLSSHYSDALVNDWLPYYYLQHPELINRFLPTKYVLRPPLHDADLRQVLIVGTMSSGTRQVVNDLQRHLSLEISHEASDASHYLVRDGTVSWFHGIRFFSSSSKEELPDFATFCRYPTPRVGFHPRFYNYAGCDASQPWSPCWAQECERILQQEWGCARRTSTNTNGCTTYQPFRTVLHQVRNPFRTTESLIAKFCGKDDEATHGPSGFGKIFRLLFPDEIAKEDDSSPRRLTCWEVVGRYVIRYTRTMLEAQNDGLINTTYPIETTSVCEVAQLAGLRNADLVVYPPNFQKVEVRCRNNNTSKRLEKPMTPTTKFKVNQGQVRLVWEDLMGGRHGSQRPMEDRSLVKELQALMVELGYDPNEIPETR